jgi:hypothetical protein
MASDSEEPGRGMLGVSMDEKGMIQLEHQDTHAKFDFARADLDEVIGVLCDFRAMLETGDLNIGDEENWTERSRKKALSCLPAH